MNPFNQGMTKLQFPEGMGTTISIEGFLMQADKDRCIEVPAKYVKDLEQQGLTKYSGTLSLKK